MDITRVSSTAELVKADHPHIGKIHNLGFLRRTVGVLTGVNRKAVALVDCSSGKRQTVALHLEPENFMVTICSSFVLVTLEEGAARHPIILKQWKLVSQNKGKGITEFFGTVNTYLDSDDLKWEHSFKRESDEDELVGFDNNGNEALIITLETLR